MIAWLNLLIIILVLVVIPLVLARILGFIYTSDEEKAIRAKEDEYIKDELSKDFMLKVHKSIDMDKKYCSRCGKEHYACYMYSINWSDELYCKDCIEDLRKEYTESINSANCGKYLDILRQLP